MVVGHVGTLLVEATIDHIKKIITHRYASLLTKKRDIDCDREKTRKGIRLWIIE